MTNKHIILLHGWGGNGDSLRELDDFLSDQTGYKTHRLEMPGHGSTPEMAYPWDMSDYTTWLKEYIDTNKITDFILIGHSFGGKIILDAVTNTLLSPEKIILMDANGIKAKNTLKKSIFKIFAHLLKPVSNIFLRGSTRYWFYRIVIGEVDYAKTSQNMKESFKIFNEENYDSKLHNIDIPTLIIWGDRDTVTPLWMGKKMNEEIKHSKMIVLNGTHGLPRTDPNEVGQHIIEFINND